MNLNTAAQLLRRPRLRKIYSRSHSLRFTAKSKYQGNYLKIRAEKERHFRKSARKPGKEET